jgi:hypothetical protein
MTTPRFYFRFRRYSDMARFVAPLAPVENDPKQTSRSTLARLDPTIGEFVPRVRDRRIRRIRGS